MILAQSLFTVYFAHLMYQALIAQWESVWLVCEGTLDQSRPAPKIFFIELSLISLANSQLQVIIFSQAVSLDQNVFS